MKIKLTSQVIRQYQGLAPDKHCVDLEIAGVVFRTECTGPDTARSLVERLSKILKKEGLT